ncbi:MAG: hypothetical protein Q7J15_13390 [Candidatus Desulfaltia sp.]|nr:hypothetical protein [Candidatus Desulfaltia sp.]
MNEVADKINDYIKSGEEFTVELDWGLLKGETAKKCQYWASRLLIYLRKSFPSSSWPFEIAKRLFENSRRTGGIFVQDIGMLIGHLCAIRDAIEAGELKHFEDEVAAGDLQGFLEYSKVFFTEGKKVESAVIVSAVFEDVIRRIADSHELDRSLKLDTIISALVRKGVITKLESKKLRVYADIRNSALHASWDEFGLSDIDDMIRGTAELVAKCMSSMVL